jgi:hypothetical protein
VRVSILCSSGHRRLLAEKSEHSSAHEERDQLEQRARQSDRHDAGFRAGFPRRRGRETAWQRVLSPHRFRAAMSKNTACPRKNNIAQHKFLQSQFYETEVWADWLALVARGRISHYCDNTFAYGIMAKLGLGIGLLGTYTAVERDAVPLDLGVLISLPLYGIALRERLRSRPVRILFGFARIFSEKNHRFRREFKPDDLPPTSDALRLLST